MQREVLKFVNDLGDINSRKEKRRGGRIQTLEED